MEALTLVVFMGLYGMVGLLLYRLYMLDKKIDKVVKNVKFEPSITVWKFFKQILFGVSSYILVEFIGIYLTSLQNWEAPIIVLFIALFNVISNVLKHT